MLFELLLYTRLLGEGWGRWMLLAWLGVLLRGCSGRRGALRRVAHRSVWAGGSGKAAVRVQWEAARAEGRELRWATPGPCGEPRSAGQSTAPRGSSRPRSSPGKGVGGCPAPAVVGGRERPLSPR